MSKSIYIINPRADFPSYFGAEVFAGRGLQRATLIADLSIATVAAFVPRDYQLEICDENLEPVDLETDAEVIAITGKISQAGRMKWLATEYRKRGKLVVIGGPFASLSPDRMRPHCDILVRGEVEEIAEPLFAHIREGNWKDEYVGTKPDLSLSPLPRWDLYANERAVMGCLQTSRGCPFECEFCDVIQYLGRKQRHKSVPQVLAELDQLYALGYRSVFLADDNFTVFRSRAKELLIGLRDWNQRVAGGEMAFVTQASIDAARDEELLEMCAQAGLRHCFIGIETPNEESLKETKKRQNVGVNLKDAFQRFYDHSITITGGMIVGFDSDDKDIFERQYRFAMDSGIPIFSIGALVAPQGTPLFDRLQTQSRLLGGDGTEMAGQAWSTNIVPARMTQDELIGGLKWLCNRLYEPAAFAERVFQALDRIAVRDDGKACCQGMNREIDREQWTLLWKLADMGPQEREMATTLNSRLLEKPGAAQVVLGALFQYNQVRYVYESGRFWDPHLQEHGDPQEHGGPHELAAVPAESEGSPFAVWKN